ncbi:MAG: hypothetical protein HFG68_04190 [Hungatella sp.]|nr:hypothetical protein [Hungatella sp.]
MKTYQYIPFSELRRQYRQERKRRKQLAEFVKMSLLAIGYGIIMGMMAAGIWVTL